MLPTALRPRRPRPKRRPASHGGAHGRRRLPRRGRLSRTATLPVPVDSPEFAAAFGVQVSVFVREGACRTDLNQPKPGRADRDHARRQPGRVEFSADRRHPPAIENGLPALASALRDAGFTSPAAVAQHSSRRRRPGGDEESRGRSTGAWSAAAKRSLPSPCSVRPIACRGGIDLYVSPAPRRPFCAAKAGLIAASPPAPLSIISLKTAPLLPSSAAGATPRRTIDARRARRYRCR
jgi:hypothetical protein